MEIIINEKIYPYEPDYPLGWKFSSGDPFKFPVPIGGHPCFVKLFNRPLTKISGWDLMNQLKGKNRPGLPRIYDIQEAILNGNLVHFVFYEFLAGKTLDLLIEEADPLPFSQLSKDIFAALREIHNQGYWHSDFCEKNIFQKEDGTFILLDLDSCTPITTLPNHEIWGCKDYWSPVFHYYRDIIGYSQIKIDDIPGSILNYLQLILMVFKLDREFKAKKELFATNSFLKNAHHSLFKEVPDSKPFFTHIFPVYFPLTFNSIEKNNFDALISKILSFEFISTGVAGHSVIVPDPLSSNLLKFNYPVTDPLPGKKIILPKDKSISQQNETPSDSIKDIPDFKGKSNLVKKEDTYFEYIKKYLWPILLIFGVLIGIIFWVFSPHKPSRISNKTITPKDFGGVHKARKYTHPNDSLSSTLENTITTRSQDSIAIMDHNQANMSHGKHRRFKPKVKIENRDEHNANSEVEKPIIPETKIKMIGIKVTGFKQIHNPIFGKREYQILGSGFKSSKKGFEVRYEDIRLTLTLEGDNILMFKAPRKVKVGTLSLINLDNKEIIPVNKI